MNPNYRPSYPKVKKADEETNIKVAEIIAQHTLMFRALQVACKCDNCPEKYVCARIDYETCYDERLTQFIADAMSVLEEQDQVKVEAVYKNIRKMRRAIKL